MDQTIQGLQTAAHAGPSLLIDILIGIAMLGGYFLVAMKQSISPKMAIAIAIGFAVVLGFITSSYGPVAFVWIWVGAMVGMAVRFWSDKRKRDAG